MTPDVTPSLTDKDISWAWKDQPEAAAPIPMDAPRSFPPSWGLLDDVQVLQLPDPEFLIDGVLQRRGVGVLYGPSGSGKTTFVAHTMVTLATGRDWFGRRICQRGSSVYVATEDPSGFKVRLAAAKRAAHLPLAESIGVFTFREPIDLRDGSSVDAFRRFLKHAAFPMPLEAIVVDTYAAATPGASENSSEDTTTAMVHAQAWRDALGVTVVLVHHTNAAGSRERGHSAMRGAADFMISVTPVDDVIHLECSKQRNAAPFDKLCLKLLPAADGTGCVLRLASDVLPASALTPAQAKVYAILRDTFSIDGATKSEWQRTCHDMPERTFYHAAKVLTERGYVKQVGTHYRPTSQELA